MSEEDYIYKPTTIKHFYSQKDFDARFSYQRRMGTFLPNHIPEDILEDKNKKKSWKKEYNEEYDIIIVSTNGTISQPYELQNIKICTPAIPKDKTKIINYDKNVNSQLWTPFEVDKELLKIENEAIDWNADKANRDNTKTPTEIFYMKPKSFIKKHLPHISRDFELRKKGVWVYICGKPIWITPSHYFQLQHMPVRGNVMPDFRFTDLDYWLFWEAVKVDHRCLGMIYLKNRRSGASTKGGGEQVNIATSISEGFVAVMSKTNRDSVSFLNKMVLRPFKKLIWYFKPVTSGTSSAASGLSFREPPKKMTARNTVMTAEGGLDTSIRQYPTSLNSMDGERVDFMVLDECGKFASDTPFQEYWSVAEECLVEGFKIVGKAMAFSTVNPMNKGGAGFKEIYNGSNVKKRMESGRTSTGLYSLFIPAEWNQEGAYCKFGYSIIDDPTSALLNREGIAITKGSLNRLIEKGEGLKKQSASLYNNFLRKHPRTEAHAWRDESEMSDFNLNKIYEQQDYNEMQDNLYEMGNFVNLSDVDGEYDIDWIPDKKNGRFRLSWIPPKELRNNFELRGGQLRPLNDFLMMGVDTYRVAQTVDKRGGSKGAMSGFTDVSMNLEEYPSEKIFLEYMERPLTLENFFQDMVYAQLFYGCRALIESNVDNYLKELKKRNMTHFSVRRTDKLKLSPDEKNLGGVSMTSEKIRNEHYFAIQKYIERHVGIDDEGLVRDKGQIGDVPFNRTLHSWSKFSMINRTSEDLSISSGLALLGFKMVKRRIKPKSKNVRDVMDGFFREYDYSKGNIGV